MLILTYGFICINTFSKIFSSVFIVFLYIFVFLFLISDSEGHKLKRACEISQALSFRMTIKNLISKSSDKVSYGGAESRKNAHRIISDKQNGILLPSRFVAIRLSAIRQTISCNKYTE